MLCPQCGRDLPPDLSACPACAPPAPVPDPAAAPPFTGYPAPPEWPHSYVAGSAPGIENWIGQGWKAFRARPWPFVLWALVLLMPSLGMEIFRAGHGMSALRPPDPEDLQLLLMTTALSVAFGIALLPLHLGGNLFSLALQRGHRPPAMKLLQAYGRGLQLLACYLVIGFCCGVVFLLLVLPSGFLGVVGAGSVLTRALVGVYLLIAVPFTVWIYLYLMLGWMFAPLMVVERHMGPLEAMRASWHLTGGRRLRLLGFMLVLMFVSILGALACLVGTLLTHGLVAGAFSAAYRDLMAQAGYPDDDLE
jgi:hypothetical protein